MSDRFFPTLLVSTLEARTPFVRTKTQETDSGRRLSVKKRTTPGYRYTISVQLCPWLNEPRDLFQFFEEHAGSYESFLYTDPCDSVVRRVRFTDDELDVTHEGGGLYSGTIELETVII